MKGSAVAKRLEGKVALITGGDTGIGESSARLFVCHGVKVVIADIRNDIGHTVCQDIECKEAASYIHCHVTKESDIQNAVDTAISKYGKLDIVFGNAAIVGNRNPKTSAVNCFFEAIFDKFISYSCLRSKKKRK